MSRPGSRLREDAQATLRRIAARGLRDGTLRPHGDALSANPVSTLRLVPAPAGAVAPGDVVVDRDLVVGVPDASLDRVDACALLAALPPQDLAPMLAEIRRALRAGGALVAGGDAPAIVARLAPQLGLEPAGPGGNVAGATYRKRSRQVEAEPLVSIVIPAWSPRFFAEALASAVGQTWQPLEIVVSDDSGDDAIAAIVRQAARSHPLRHVRNASRLGTRGNMARGLAEARGTFVKFLNDDDRLAPDCVAALVAAYRLAPDAVLATSRRRCIDDAGRALPDLPATTPIAGEDVVVAGTTLANAMLLAGLNVVGEPSTALFRRDDLDLSSEDPFALPGVPARGAVDMALWTRLLLRGDAVWLARPLSDFRLHPAQSQRDPAKRPRAIAGIRSLQQAWLDLGFAARLPPTAILARRHPPADEVRWHWQPVPALEAIAQQMRRHPPSDRWRYAIDPTVRFGGHS